MTYHFYHYNGLPPSGPLLTHTTCKLSIPALLSPSTHVWDVALLVSRKKVGAPVEVQGGGGGCGEEEWLYECACRGGTPEQAAAITSLTTVPDGSKWRCRNCSLKVPIVWSAVNEKSTTICKECGQNISESGCCVWLKYEQLPQHQQREADNFSTTSIETLLKQLFSTAKTHYKLVLHWDCTRAPFFG
eukprot:TRINITY_DN3713_c0_g1_i1.p1 TRINITY_DN3713_c0_g1~~TRINITY_DN3713_c0_g1_i1.p1  ORF type:complete len:188 (-),score=30.12 TRINITY_DN3713_c0_g1_i1:141-704(-)